MNEYTEAINQLTQVVSHGRSLDTSKLSPLASEMTFGVLRHYHELAEIAAQLLKKPLPKKHVDLRLLILLGIYASRELRRPQHASVNIAVDSVKLLGKPWASGLVNATLRRYLRETEKLNATTQEGTTNHPNWLIDRITAAWPGQSEEILYANNQRPPMTLRINQAKTDRDSYLKQLQALGINARYGELSDVSLILEKGIPVTELPGFSQGLVSIQDEASQLAASFLNPRGEERILDACAAPGGKACHLLEQMSSINLVANDIDKDRLSLVTDNLSRLGLSCKVSNQSIQDLTAEKFDRILLDAPCSATGIIRRHPDIKLLRQDSDIDKLSTSQGELLHSAWDLLKPGGEVLYSTCSVLPEENERVISMFLESRPEAQIKSLSCAKAFPQKHGIQLLPGVANTDGFYYALLAKAGE